MIYPSLSNQRAFSTNHYEEGVHSINPDQLDKIGVIVPDVLRADKGWQDFRFTTPLVGSQETGEIQELFKEFDNQNLPLIDCYHEVVTNGDSSILVQKGKMFVQNLRFNLSNSIAVTLIA